MKKVVDIVLSLSSDSVLYYILTCREWDFLFLFVQSFYKICMIFTCISAEVEPYLIRIVTHGGDKHGLKSVCLDWEQIACESWHEPPEHDHVLPPFHDEF